MSAMMDCSGVLAKAAYATSPKMGAAIAAGPRSFAPISPLSPQNAKTPMLLAVAERRESSMSTIKIVLLAYWEIPWAVRAERGIDDETLAGS